MKTRLLLLTFLCLNFLHAQVDYFPPLQGDEWETTDPATLGWCAENIDSLFNFLDEKNTKAFLILKDGKIVLEKYYGDTEIASNLPWNSAGKTITALMVGIAQENGLLSIQDKTSDYLGSGWTSLASDKEDSIKIIHQLTMTSGLDDLESFCVTPECLTYLVDAGTRWAYHNGPYTLLTDVIEEASGLTMNNYTTLNLKLQTGLDGAYIPLGTNKVFFGPARGMARMGLLMLNQGTWDETLVLGDMDYYQQMISPSQDINQSYGYLWWLNGYDSFMLPGSQTVFPGFTSINAPNDLFSGLGKNSQILDVVPSQNLVVIRMGDDPDDSLVPLIFHDEMWAYINKLSCTTTSTEQVDLTKAIKIYPNPTQDQLHIDAASSVKTIQVFNTLGQLVLDQEGGPRVSLQDLSPGIYWLQLIDQADQRFSQKIIKQ